MLPFLYNPTDSSFLKLTDLSTAQWIEPLAKNPFSATLPLRDERDHSNRVYTNQIHEVQMSDHIEST